MGSARYSQPLPILWSSICKLNSMLAAHAPLCVCMHIEYVTDVKIAVGSPASCIHQHTYMHKQQHSQIQSAKSASYYRTHIMKINEEREVFAHNFAQVYAECISDISLGDHIGFLLKNFVACALPACCLLSCYYCISFQLFPCY